MIAMPRAAATPSIANQVNQPSRERWPEMAMASNQGEEIMLRQQSSVPPRFVPSAVSKSPSITKAQDVVMPQPGHRNPVKLESVHGGSPNWVWVPIPLGSGRSQAASARIAIRPPAAQPN